MPYQSIFSGSGSSTSAPASSGGGYQSPLGLGTVSVSPAAKPKSQKQKDDEERKRREAEAKAKREADANSFLGKAKKLGVDLAKSVRDTGEKTLNTVGAGEVGIVGAAKATGQLLTGNKKGAAKTADETNRIIASSLDKGLGGKGGFLSSKQASSTGGGTKGLKENYINPASKGVAELAPYTPVGKAAKGASILRKVVTDVVANSALSAGTDAGAQKINTGKVDLKQTGMAAVTGAAVPGVIHGTGIAGKAATKPIVNAVENSKANTAATKELINQTRRQSIFDLANKTVDPKAPVPKNMSAIQEKALQDVMASVKPGPAVTRQAAAEAQATAANAKAAAENAKIDQKIQLIEAKKADGKFTNVDKVRVDQLQATKQPSIADGVADAPAVVSPNEAPLAPPLQGKSSATVASEVPSANDTPHPIKIAIDRHYKGGKQGKQEAQAYEHITNNPDKAVADYDARVQEKFGASNVVSGDEAKYVIPGFNSTKSASYHEPASALAKVKYEQLLADTATADKPVLLMAGGSGAGKTSALKRLGINYDNYAAVIDTNSNKVAGAESRIQQAIDSGRPVQVFYVHRDPVKAFTQGVIPRGGKEGRIVPIDTHIDTHYGSHDVIHQLHEKYKDNPLVDFEVASNNHGHGKAKSVMLDEIPKMRYTKEELKTVLKKATDNAHQEGKISPEEHSLYHGEASTPAKAMGASTGKQLESKRPTGSTGQPSQVTGPRRLTPLETAHMEPIDGYTHSSDMVKDYATMLRDMELSVKGGQLVSDGEKYGYGMKRTSEHGKFYREFFKENKHAPRIADYREHAQLLLETGKDDWGAGDTYKALLDRESKPVPRIEVAPAVSGGPQGTSKVASRLAKDLKGRTEGLAQYDKINIKDQAEKALKAVEGDRAQLERYLSGADPLPDGLHPTALITAIRHTKDPELVLKAAQSPLSSESSFGAQELRLARENAAGDPVQSVRNLKALREKAVEKRLGKPVAEAVKTEVEAIRAAKPRVTRQDWSSFIESIKC